jgi:hypothetical protein
MEKYLNERHSDEQAREKAYIVAANVVERSDHHRAKQKKSVV